MSKEYGASQTAQMRFETYRKSFTVAVIGLVGMAAVTGLSVAGSLWAVSRAQTKETVYFAAREDGSILPLIGVEQPYLSDNAVVNFGVEAITESLSLSFANFEDSLQKANQYFTKPAGWNEFLRTLNESQIPEFIRNNRLVSTVVANNARITGRGTNERGEYQWQVEIPITINYVSSSASSKEDRLAIIQMVRVPTWASSRAIAIRQVLIRRP